MCIHIGMYVRTATERRLQHILKCMSVFMNYFQHDCFELIKTDVRD